MNINIKRPAIGRKVGVNAPVAGRPPQVMERFNSRATRVGVNESVAPVCPISRPQTPPAMPGIRVPVVGRATDLPSAIAAINSIITILNEDTIPHVKWLEKERVTARVRIFNPDDDTQWVDVIRIMKLIMEDQDNGDLWVWEL